MKTFKLTIILLFLFAWLPSHAERVTRQTAMTVGKNFVQSSEMFASLKSNLVLQLAYEEVAAESTAAKDSSASPYFYVFNINEDKGFVIVAGDDHVIPVLGYAVKGNFNLKYMPSGLLYWLNEYKQQVNYVQKHGSECPPEIAALWAGHFSNMTLKGGNSIQPWIKSEWSQGTPYNDSCPFIGATRAVTGCVATAMAQVMKFWSYPESGFGQHYYFDPGSGQPLSADFASTSYRWSEMPLKPQSGVSYPSLSTLMLHCGISVDMFYGPESASATFFAADALKKYFGYSSDLHYTTRSTFSDDNSWISELKKELQAGRPLLYRGKGAKGGHSFICDGFDSQSFFHFNWGWSGSYNGTYLWINDLTPGGMNFSQDQAAVFGIQPPLNMIKYDIRLCANLVVVPNPVTYGTEFKVTTNFANYGNAAFSGDFCAAIFEANGTFVDYVQIKTPGTLPGGNQFSASQEFVNSQLYGLLPGTYKIWVYYRPTGGEWKAVANNGGYVNFSTVTIQNKNDIELNKPITLMPNTWYQGQSASVNVDFKNFGTNTFLGYYGAGLYDLSGKLVETIQVVEETRGLPSGGSYGSPYWTLTNPALNAEPGTYLLGVQHNPNKTGWQLTGSSYYQNPIKVTVLPTPLLPDPYEVNDSYSTSYLIQPVFIGNSAPFNTDGANIHQSTDIDYFKLNLQSGYNYTISGSLLNKNFNPTSNNNLKGQIYFSTDGITWTSRSTGSFSYPGNLSGGTSIYMVVSGEELGYTGTYRLELSLNRSPTVTQPTVTTTAITGQTQTTANGGGNVTSEGGSGVTARGVCWSTSQSPTISSSKTTNNTGAGVFTSNLTGLSPNTTYYVKAYATNSVGTGYGEQVTFTTLQNTTLPTVTTTAITGQTQTTANGGGNVTSEGGSGVTARGVCWSTSQSPTISSSKTTNNTGAGVFTSNLTGLSPNTTYYVKAYATNSVGTGYGEQVTFTTLQNTTLPTVTTTAITGQTQTTANGGGNVTSEGGSGVTARGVCWSTSQSPTISSSKTTNNTGAGVFTSNLTGLSPNTTYYVKAYATNSVGTGYGEQVTFTTLQNTTLPTVTTTAITGQTQTTANGGGNVTSEGGSGVTARGVCWSTSQSPTISSSKTTNNTGAGVFTSNLTGLSPNTTYYVKAYATNSVGTGYGEQVTFTTLQNTTLPTVTTTAITGQTQTTANGGGNVTSEGGSGVTARGVCWSTSQSPTISSSKTTNNTGAGVFTSNLTGLSPNTTYYVKAYATNSVGTGYGEQVTFTTNRTGSEPTVNTIAATFITENTAISGGNVTNNGGSPLIARGVCWSINEGPEIIDNKTIDGATLGLYTSVLLYLAPNTTYYYRAYASNSIGTGYGSQYHFTTLPSSGIEWDSLPNVIKVYPNPAHDIINIDLSELLRPADRVDLIDQIGQIVYSYTTNQSNGLIQISTSGLAPGLYLIHVQVDERRILKRVIIE